MAESRQEIRRAAVDNCTCCRLTPPLVLAYKATLGRPIGRRHAVQEGIEWHPMNRRDFLTRYGLGSYSLVVLADAASAQQVTVPNPPPAPSKFEQIAPNSAAFD